MFSLFAPRDCVQAIAFLEHFRTSLFPWTLIATGRGRAQVVTFTPQLHGAAAEWIMKMQTQGRDVLLLMAETHGSVTGVKLVRGHLRGTRHFGVKLLLNQAKTLEAFNPKPFLRLEAGGRLYVAWRFINEVPIERAEALADDLRLFFRIKGVTVDDIETSRIVWQRIDEPDADMPTASAKPSPSTRDETGATSVDAWLRLALGQPSAPSESNMTGVGRERP